MEFPQYQDESEEQRLLRVAHSIGLNELFTTPRILGRDLEVRVMQARSRMNELQVDVHCSEFAERTGVGISDGARALIKMITDAIISDPHPAWDASPSDRLRAVTHYISELPEMLAAVAREENVRDQINTFDLLHWVSQDRDLARICIIEKRA